MVFFLAKHSWCIQSTKYITKLLLSQAVHPELFGLKNASGVFVLTEHSEGNRGTSEERSSDEGYERSSTRQSKERRFDEVLPTLAPCRRSPKFRKKKGISGTY